MAARLRAFAAFWYDFVVGDDWRVAAGVVVALVVTAVPVSAAGVMWWCVVPAAVVIMLPLSLWRAVRAGRT